MKNSEPNQPGSKNRPPKDIVVRTFDFAVLVVQLCVKLDGRPGVGRVLMGQIPRSGTSVPANVEAAQAAPSKADFISMMSIALKEARETHFAAAAPSARKGGSDGCVAAVDSGGRRNQAGDRGNCCFHETRRC